MKGKENLSLSLDNFNQDPVEPDNSENPSSHPSIHSHNKKINTLKSQKDYSKKKIENIRRDPSKRANLNLPQPQAEIPCNYYLIVEINLPMNTFRIKDPNSIQKETERKMEELKPNSDMH